MAQPAGWYLGLRYMQGQGLIARFAEPIDSTASGLAGAPYFIFADRVLCHIQHWRKIIDDWWNHIAIGGSLILWLPDCRFHESEPNASRVTLDDIQHALDHRQGWVLREADIIDGHIYVVWQKTDDERQEHRIWTKQPRHMLVARTGAHGDALMASSILPALKDQGWHISFITKCPGFDVLQHDPHIDELIFLAEGQITDEDMPYYWQAWEKRFDRFVNLTYSVEGELLKHPSRPDYWWSQDQRRVNCARSYLGYLHRLADVPAPYRVCFHPSSAEKKTVAQQAETYGPFILWCLRGSSPHKWWPYGAQAICQILRQTPLNIVITGDAEALPLANEIQYAIENFHGDATRLRNLIDTHSIREVMALAHHASIVIGPETGILNAVSMQPVPKILFLSHSAPSNLSDDWIATTPLQPTSACYPCHRLHYNHDWCPQDAVTTAAACSASIPVKAVIDAVLALAPFNASQPWWQRGHDNLDAA